MKKFVALLTKEKWLRINGKMMADILQALYSVYEKIRAILFQHVLV